MRPAGSPRNRARRISDLCETIARMAAPFLLGSPAACPLLLQAGTDAKHCEGEVTQKRLAWFVLLGRNLGEEGITGRFWGCWVRRLL